MLMSLRSRSLVAVLVVLACRVVVPASARADTSVYDDALEASWQDWSWGGITRDFSRTSPVHAGTRSIAVTFTDGWSGLQLGRNTTLDVSAYDYFRFYVHGGTSGGQSIEVEVGNNGSGASVSVPFQPAANTWTKIDVPLAELGSPAQVNYIHWFNATAGSQAIFYLDDVAFIASGLPTPTPLPPGAGPALSVDVSAARHDISPYIYGMNFADENLAAELDLPVRRWGGNATTRYNWQNDTSNRSFDWYFENIPNDNANPGALPDGSSSDLFVEQDRRTGTATLMTIPMIGWTPKARARSCGFSVAKYGAQQSTDPWSTDCGNGVRSNGTKITSNDPNDTSVVIGPTFVQSWMSHLIAKYADAAGGGVPFYNLDNEPELWSDTHRDVHPTPLSYDEIRDRTFQYAAAVKASDPSARTLGPASWGWTAYFWSALDWSAGGSWWSNPQDRLAHGNVPFVEWYLQQMRSYEQQHGQRILDYLDLHYYPQAGGVSLSGAGNITTQALRLRSTRSLWDPTYVDESWIGEAVRLLPRMRAWVDTNYPGTKLALTEYNWGALDHINGALAQADVLGIFGREGLDLATLWDPPTSSEPGAFAFRMFRNFDGAGARFGDVGVSAASGDQSLLAVYAAQQSTSGAVTVMVINKSTQALTSSVALTGFAPAPSAQVFRYSAANLSAIVPLSTQTISSGGFTATFPPSSMTLFVVGSGGGPLPTGTPTPTGTQALTPTLTPTVPPGCGDGVLDLGEQCDDGNLTGGDGCASSCLYELIPGNAKGTSKFVAAGCVMEWSVVNPGNAPAFDRYGRRSAVQTCRDNDPTCDQELDPTARACAMRVVVCLNNVDPALATCAAEGVADGIRIQSPTLRRDPVNATALAVALTNLRDAGSGNTGFGLPVAPTARGLCSEPFTLRVPLGRSATAAGKLRVRVSATSLDGSRQDRDAMTFVCTP